MSLLKRVSTTLNASISSIVSRVEDHDAIIDASVRECRLAAARTRSRLLKVQRDGEQLQTRRDNTQKNIDLWSQRAIESAEADEETAIKCLRRKKLGETELHKLDQAVAEHSVIKGKLQTQLDQITARISEINQKRNTLRSRQSMAEAMHILDKIDGDSSSSVDDTFERWESVLLERELAGFVESQTDSFETQFLDQEELHLLRAELKSLLSVKEEHNNE